MLLSKITADPARHQFRQSPFSETTVTSIVAEGIDLATWLDSKGQDVMGCLATRVTEDGEMLADMVASPQTWKARPASPADARMASQYDSRATQPMFS
jgi:hypothetical protein